MRIVLFGPDRRLGAVAGDRVLDLQLAAARRGSTALDGIDGLLAFIEAGARAVDEAQLALDVAASSGLLESDEGVSHPLSAVRLHAPWPGRRIACVGGNYGEHLLGMQQSSGGADKSLEAVVAETRAAGQWGFWKVPADVGGPGDEVPYPSRTEYFDYEGEAAIVIGRRCKNVRAEAIDDYVYGVTLVNDWSIRDGGGTARGMSYNLAKNFDGSVSMGPAVVVGETHHGDVEVETRVNGELRQHYSSKSMVFSFAEVLEYLSRDFTFVPGDVISGGTGPGTAADKTRRLADGTRPKDLFLSIGDVIEVSSPAIGPLANRVVASD